eukprot:213022-Chlamydomonas_euryale.AAC.4
MHACGPANHPRPTACRAQVSHDLPPVRHQPPVSNRPLSTGHPRPTATRRVVCSCTTSPTARALRRLDDGSTRRGNTVPTTWCGKP